ncbi:MAG: tetratricopeptide repeat protein [Chloroflexi bacterium]|nr:tetratricopeptide repeat protein [Chloroflexota bacterium]
MGAKGIYRISMNELQQEERQRARRQLIERSIELAMRSSWEEAADANRRLVEQFEPDVEAWNRLGKAYAELGRIADAREAYLHSLSIEPANAIAQRNANRLSVIKDSVIPVSRDHHDSVDARFFIEESGKTIARSIFTSVPPEVLSNLSAGDRLALMPQDDLVLVSTAVGQELGFLDGKLSARLIELLTGGNEYAAAAVRIEGRYIRVMIRETYQAPQLTGRVSFPPETSTGFKPYTKDTLVRQDRFVEDDEDLYSAFDVDADDSADAEDSGDAYDDNNDT